MIGKSGKLLVLLYVGFLIVLFLMCSTDLIIKEPEKEIYQISVIVEDVRDDNYSNFRKGMDQAAVEFNADVRLITLYEKLDADQQMEFISREQQDGADALIVVPVDEKEVEDALEDKQVTIPMVILNAGPAESTAAGMITVDYREMGRQVAEQIHQQITVDSPVIVLSEPDGQSIMSRRFLEGAISVLEQEGYSCQIVAAEESHGWKAAMEELRTLPWGQATILAESPELLTEAAGILADDPVFAEWVQGLYGRGSTITILSELDRELISGICITDEFSRGYFSVYMAMQALEDSGNRLPMVLNSYYIEKQDLRKPEYEKMLFPVE